MLSRRHFVTSLVVTLPLLGASRPAVARSMGTRALRFEHTHTGEKLAVAYFDQGTYVTDALASVNHFLRDFRTGDVREIDTGLLDLLHRLTARTETARPFEVISGYRSPVTNAALRRGSEGVAAGSLHMVGRAIDVRLRDVPLDKLRTAALAARSGGVGYYPASDFVHVDTGRIRFW